MHISYFYGITIFLYIMDDGHRRVELGKTDNGSLTQILICTLMAVAGLAVGSFIGGLIHPFYSFWGDVMGPFFAIIGFIWGLSITKKKD